MSEKEIKNNIEGGSFLPRNQLKNFQGALKLEDKALNKKLQHTIKKRGFDAPVYIWYDHDNFILDGHQRLKALNSLADEGYELPDDKVPVVFVKAETEKEAKEKVLEYNSRYSDFNMPALDEFAQGLDLDGISIDGLKPPILEDDVDEDSVPDFDVSIPPVVKLGDIFHLGQHRLMCGDSTDYEQLQLLTQKQPIDCVWTDPPYNVNYSGRGKNTSNGIENDNMTDQAFQEFIDKCIMNMKDACKKGAPLYIFHSHKTQDQFMEAIDKAGLDIKAQLIWNKMSYNRVGGDYKQKHEPFFYCIQKGSSTVFYGDISEPTVWSWEKTDEQLLGILKKARRAEEEGKTSIWTFKKHNVHDYVHPTQKPVDLVTRALENSSKEGDIVLDLFLGSGTCLIGAEKTKRICYGMEFDPHYAQVIIKRYYEYMKGQVEIKCLNRDIDIKSIVFL